MGRRYGQHFLHDQRVLRDIVAAAALRPGEPVLEVGPGEGALTEHLLAAGVRLTAVEVDPALAGRLETRWSDEPRFRLLRGDVLKLELSPEALFGPEAAGMRYAVVANLPYYLSTPLLFRFVAARARCTRLVLMVQQEVAARMAVGPEAGKEYGSLGIAVQYAFTVRRVRTVPPGAFRPPPRVQSSVVALEPLPPTLPAALEPVYLEHVKHLFTQRRKRLAGTLKARYPDAGPSAWSEAAALVGERRPDALTPAEHLAVFRLLHGLPPTPDAPRSPA